jgi:hypothetical protein
LSTFEELVDEFCFQAGLPESSEIARGLPFEVNGVASALHRDEHFDPGCFQVYTDFGPPPQAREATVYYELLKRNIENGASRDFQYGVLPATGHVVRVDHLPLESATVDLLGAVVVAASTDALEWRKTRFLCPLEEFEEQESRQAREERLLLGDAA